MSYTTLYKVPESGPIEVFAKFNNSHRGAPILWDYLGRKYSEDFDSYIRDGAWSVLGSLASDDRLEDHERLVLASTYDNAMARREDFLGLANAMDRIAKEMTRRSGGFGEPEVTVLDGGNYPEHAAALRRLAEDPGAFAACWDQTSVADDGWNRYDTCECCGQELEDWRSFDLSKDDGNIWLEQFIGKQVGRED